MRLILTTEAMRNVANALNLIQKAGLQVIVKDTKRDKPWMSRMTTEKKLMGVEEAITGFERQGLHEKAEKARQTLKAAAQELKDGSYTSRGIKLWSHKSPMK